VRSIRNLIWFFIAQMITVSLRPSGRGIAPAEEARDRRLTTHVEC
jgi:hypothetical protein